MSKFLVALLVHMTFALAVKLSVLSHEFSNFLFFQFSLLLH